ncbi:unnamed protein product [Ranitomeya imitator]|uniref:ribonuclease H n=1 Tax=Ranitomeya imitator TaxID=111125 RepID=A0ABN9MPW0_9NEOB|nr:unnamed protein product [Ranitomeya imitator]
MLIVQENLLRAQEAQAMVYNRSARLKQFGHGVLVTIVKSKFLAKWQGPYEVIEKLSNINCNVHQPERRKLFQVYHINQLKLWRDRELVEGLSATFQRAMDQILASYKKYATAYLDFIVIFSPDWGSHLQKVQVVLDALRKSGFTINPKKCATGKEEAKYLGYKVRRGEIRQQVNKAPSPHITTRCSILTHYHTRLRPRTLPHEAPSTHITTRGSVPAHYHTRLRPHTLPHDAPSSHITTRGSVPAHYHTRLHPHTLPHEAPSPHITTQWSVLTHYHTMLHPHTLPHEAPSPHITTRGSVHTHYHMRLHPHTLPHQAPSPHITKQGSVPTHYHMRLCPHTLPHEAPLPAEIRDCIPPLPFIDTKSKVAFVPNQK